MEVFQTFEYNGKLLQLATYGPQSSARPVIKNPSIKAPGAGKFEIGMINLSVAKVAVGEEFTLTSRVNGRNIAYVYSEVLLRDKSFNQFYGPVAREYIQAERNRRNSGVSRPDWDETINIAVRLNPRLRLLTDGVDSAFGFLIPADYDNPAYRVDGLYTPADGAAQHSARITFDNTSEPTVVAYKEQGSHATPHALTFKQGDQFAPLIQILNQPTDENQTWQITKGLSTSLTYRGQPFRWVEELLMPGDYLVGLLVQDFDGGFTRKYTSLTVNE